MSFGPFCGIMLCAGTCPARTRSSVELEPSVVWSNTVGSILCVARSGEAGIHAQNDAIRIAKDRGEPLVFLFIADSSFLNNLSAPLVVDIKSILEGLGRFLLYSAVQRASAEGVKARRLVRHGVMREVLPTVVPEIDPTMIIVGQVIGEPSCFERTEMDKVLRTKKE